MILELEDLRIHVAHLASASVRELFPDAVFIASYTHPNGFFCDFAFPFSFKQEFLPLIEEKMRKIVKEKRPVKMKEMVPVSAAAFLESKGLDSESVRHSEETLVQLLEMGAFIAPCPPTNSLFNDTGEISSSFRMLAFEERVVTRLEGTAFPDKDSLKKFLKRSANFETKDHEKLGSELSLFSQTPEGEWVFHPKGEALRKQLLDFWREQHAQQNFAFLHTPPPTTDLSLTSAHCNYFLQFPHNLLAEHARLSSDDSSSWERGLLTSSYDTIDRAHIFCEEGEVQDKCISSLQFIVKILKILRFKFELVLCASGETDPLYKKGETALQEALIACDLKWLSKRSAVSHAGPRIEVRIEDALGLKWPASFLEVACKETARLRIKKTLLVRSLYGSLERFIALLLEESEGALPFLFAPEQVRVLSVGVKQEGYAAQVCETLRKAGFRASFDSRREEKLGMRLHEGLKEKIPYLAVIGEREEQQKLVTVRAFPKVEGEAIDLEEWIVNLKTESNIENQ